MLQAAARATPVPRGTITRLTAKPSGMLCTAIAIAIRTPSVAPSPKETPTPTPSVNECTVIALTNAAAFSASAPCSVAKVRCLRCARTAASTNESGSDRDAEQW